MNFFFRRGGCEIDLALISQVRPCIPQEVADLISRCRATVQFRGKNVFF